MGELEKQIWAKSMYPRQVVPSPELTQKERRDLGAINLAITISDVSAILDEARRDFPCQEGIWKFQFGLDENFKMSSEDVHRVFAWYVKWFGEQNKRE